MVTVENAVVTFPGRVANDRPVDHQHHDDTSFDAIVLRPSLPLVAVAQKQRPAIDHYFEAPQPCFILELTSSAALAEVYS